MAEWWNAWAEEDARAAAAEAQELASAKLDEATNATALIDTATFADASLAPESSRSTVAKVKKKGKAKLTPKEKKERSVRVYSFCFFLKRCSCLSRLKMAIDKVILSLPLEFRGKDPVSVCLRDCWVYACVL